MNTYIIATTNALGGYDDPAAPFILANKEDLEGLRAHAEQAFRVLDQIDSDLMPQVSFRFHARHLDEDGLHDLGLTDDQIEDITQGQVHVADYDEEALAKTDRDHLWRAADLVRANFHDDGDTWLLIYPKNGDPYEANVTIYGGE